MNLQSTAINKSVERVQLKKDDNAIFSTTGVETNTMNNMGISKTEEQHLSYSLQSISIFHSSILNMESRKKNCMVLLQWHTKVRGRISQIPIATEFSLSVQHWEN